MTDMNLGPWIESGSINFMCDATNLRLLFTDLSICDTVIERFMTSFFTG